MLNNSWYVPAFRVGLLALGVSATAYSAEAPDGQYARMIRVQGDLLEIRSPALTLTLEATTGLKAISWSNRLTGVALSLGGGPEVELEVGQPGKPHLVKLDVFQQPQAGASRASADSSAELLLSSKDPALSVKLTYRLDARHAVLRKFVQVTNASDKQVELLNVRLGNYQTDAAEVTIPRQGFPAYLSGQFFMSLAHPSGWAKVQGRSVSLAHFPGVKLAPGQVFNCMEAVYGVSPAGAVCPAFRQYVASRMRRVVRGHDQPYAIFEPFGARPGGSFDETASFLLDNIAKVVAGAQESGARFDYYLVDFWQDVRGDLTHFAPQRFPSGFAPVKTAIDQAGMLPGLWIDSGGLPAWTIGENPLVQPCFTEPNGRGILCRASEPIKSMYTKAFIHHIKENGVRLLKFDNLGPDCKFPVCNNLSHGHLGGPYSLEAMHNSVIEFLGELDRACPEVFLMLYWGYCSPWWLLHADTYFEPGVLMEGASPSSQPAPFARSSIIQRGDQVQWLCTDTPWLGKDSLGVWLSDWPWNSCVGKVRWQESVVMDICRGSMLAQIWSDTPWLSPPERKQIADFIALMKANPRCFANSRFIIGDPGQDEPYGYACTDGQRAFLAIHNACWKDSTVSLKFGPEWGLAKKSAWDLYRWHDAPARLKPRRGEHFGAEAILTLRPFEVVLLEVVPAGKSPSLNRAFETKSIPAGFAEASQKIELTEPIQSNQATNGPGATWVRLHPTSAVSAGGASLTIQKEGAILAGGMAASNDAYTVAANITMDGITGILLETIPDPSLPATGPGRASNGNFALMEFAVSAAAIGPPNQAMPLKLQNPQADFSQSGYGGWGVRQAMDGDLKTGWSIDPEEGMPHVAMFELAQPLRLPGGATLTCKLAMGDREHSIGRFALYVTTAQTPLLLPKGYGGRVSGNGRRVLIGQIPASAAGGLLVVSARQPDGSAKGVFTCETRIDGQPAVGVPVWSDLAYWSGSWQAWRMEVGPSGRPRPVEVVISKQTPGGWNWACHFIPK